MATRSFAQAAPTSGTIALNAFIYGYAGHSLVTPHVALKQLWWTDERIKAKVTRNFVESKLRSEERVFLDRPLGFGEGLTDDTYVEWILERAKRLFLILAEVGVPDQIFGCIDDTWDDAELPVPLDSLDTLKLSEPDDVPLNIKFYDTQFIYLLRELQQGLHIDYGPREHIPMEHVNTIPPAVSLQIWDRVHFPGTPDAVYMRRKYSLLDKESGKDYRDSFMRDIRKSQKVAHKHIAPVWASYTTENSGYVISDLVAEHTLGTFIDHRMPAQFQRIPAAERPALLCEWMHCLSDTLAFLHYCGVAHTAIRPSNILITRTNRIAFTDIGCLKTFQRGKRVNKIEVYDYAAPGSPLSLPEALASSPPTSSMGAFSKLRKRSSSPIGSSGSSSPGNNTRSNSICTIPTIPITRPSTERSNSITTTMSPIESLTGGFRKFSRHLDGSTVPLSPTSTDRMHALPAMPNVATLHDLPGMLPQMSDIYSFACILLDIITFMVKGKTNDFVKFRSSRVTSPVSGKKRVRNDASFHFNPSKIDAWIVAISSESERLSGKVFRGVPELLRLVQQMMTPNAVLRPTAINVRNQIQKILVDTCGLETLCCADREWSIPTPPNGSFWSSSDNTRDSISTAAGVSLAPLSRTASACPRSAGQLEDGSGVLSQNRSQQTSQGGAESKPTSGTAARTSSWRRAFSRS